jgi:hypothetical protein
MREQARLGMRRAGRFCAFLCFLLLVCVQSWPTARLHLILSVVISCIRFVASRPTAEQVSQRRFCNRSRSIPCGSHRPGLPMDSRSTRCILRSSPFHIVYDGAMLRACWAYRFAHASKRSLAAAAPGQRPAKVPWERAAVVLALSSA